MYQLNIDLRPGVGAGTFDLGHSLWQVINIIREDKTTYPKVDLQWDVDSPATSPIILRTPHRLSMISVHTLRSSPPLTLRYKDSVISSWSPDNQADVVLRRKDVGSAFGPTYPGDSMRYPGVWFGFDDDRDQGKPHAKPSADDRTMQVRKVVITQKGEKDALEEPEACPAMHGELHRARIRLHEGVDLYFYPSFTTAVSVRIGQTSAQDLSLDVGTPLRVYYKEDDRMNIHASAQTQQDDAVSDYFYNYLQYGMDILISGKTHIVKKIILHSNIPGSPMFQRYKRCPWEFVGADKESRGPSFIDKIDAIQGFVAPHLQEKPLSMVHDRLEDDGLALPTTTRLIGFDGVVLETAESELVLSMTLF
ncbi:UPF0183-domain-containing protein [Auriculariales sp. MPI-PUGE-AT-0066]|nr:UPF0183-domain-containing protein [Auriculariales sp. MPI-PUGE-AT-0066]